VTANIFHYTKFDPVLVYKFFSPSVQTERQRLFTLVERVSKKDEEQHTNIFPEMFQIVMVNSEILRRLFKEECMKPVLLSRSSRFEETYASLFGSMDEAYEGIPYLEVPPEALPTGNAIVLKNMKRVISPNLMAVASFFSLAIYDEKSFNHALVLLISEAIKTGAPIPQLDRIFGTQLNEDDIF
jgi:hypothetical protein